MTDFAIVGRADAAAASGRWMNLRIAAWSASRRSCATRVCPEFPRADDETLLAGMATAARLDLPVAVHAESDEMTRTLARHARRRPCARVSRVTPDRGRARRDRAGPSNSLAKPVPACTLSMSVPGAASCSRAKRAPTGVDVSIETCPHYLFFTADDLERLGTFAKCAPPLRDAREQEALWKSVRAGLSISSASDHSPAEPSMKQWAFGSAWGGIAGVQSTLPVLLDRGLTRAGCHLPRIVSLLAGNPARRFRIERKGALRVGYDADLVLVDLDASSRLRADDLLQRHPLSPYVGETFRGVVRRTLRGGETIARMAGSSTRKAGLSDRPGQS